MNQHIKNKNNQKSSAGAAECDKYCEDTLAESHENVTLTTRLAHGLTTVSTYLRDIKLIKAAFQFLQRFKPGKQPKIENDWVIITEAPTVTLSPVQMQAKANVVYRTAGPGTIGKFNNHVPEEPDEKGVIKGSDGNYSLCPLRKIGPHVERRRDSRKSEYRMLKVAQEEFRRELQKKENVVFPDTDAKLEHERRAAKKSRLSEKLAAREWTRLQKLPPPPDGILAVDFQSDESLLRNTDTARAALEELGFGFTETEHPAALIPGGDPLAGHMFMIGHPEWKARREKNAKKPIPANSPPPKIRIDLLQMLLVSRANGLGLGTGAEVIIPLWKAEAALAEAGDHGRTVLVVHLDGETKGCADSPDVQPP